MDGCQGHQSEPAPSKPPDQLRSVSIPGVQSALTGNAFRQRPIPTLQPVRDLTAQQIRNAIFAGSLERGGQSINVPPEPGSPLTSFGLWDLAAAAGIAGLDALRRWLENLWTQLWGNRAGRLAPQEGIWGSTDLDSGSIGQFQIFYRSGTVNTPLYKCSNNALVSLEGDYTVMNNARTECRSITFRRTSCKMKRICQGSTSLQTVWLGMEFWKGPPGVNFAGEFGVNQPEGLLLDGEYTQTIEYIFQTTKLLKDGVEIKPAAFVDPTPLPPYPIPVRDPETEKEKEKEKVRPIVPPVVPVLPQVPDETKPVEPVPPVTPSPGPGPGPSPSPGPGPAPSPITPTVPVPVPIPIAPAQPVTPTRPAPSTPADQEFYPDGTPIIGTNPRATLAGIALEVGRIERKALDIFDKIQPKDKTNDWGNQLGALFEWLQTIYLAGEYRISSPCEYDKDGNPAIPLVASWEGGSGPDNEILARLDALAQLLQHHKTQRQPTCRPSGPAVGESVTIRFQSLELQPSGKDHLRKVLTYRDQASRSLEEHTAHWAGFRWFSGPWRVQGLGKWGKVEVWARDVNEGKRVIRHACYVSGINPFDPSELEWTVQRSASNRLGQFGTMVLKDLRYGDSVTKRDGSSGRPEVVVPD